MPDYLVFEQAAGGTGAPSEHYAAMGQNAPPVLHPYAAIGAVRAPDPSEAVKAVMAYTRRIGKYAVIEATVVDFTFSPTEEAGTVVQLNPGPSSDSSPRTSEERGPDGVA